jgi:hypothetical protein
MAVDAHLEDMSEEVEFGLRTPDGTVLWPPDTYRGYPFATPQERNALADILLEAGRELKVDPVSFAASFKWVPRSKTTFVVCRVADTVLDMGVKFDVPEVTDGESTPNE